MNDHEIFRIRALARYMIRCGITVSEAHDAFVREESIVTFPSRVIGHLIYGIELERGGGWRRCGMYKAGDIRIGNHGWIYCPSLGLRVNVKGDPYQWLWDNGYSIPPDQVYRKLKVLSKSGRAGVMAEIADVTGSEPSDAERIRRFCFGPTLKPVRMRFLFWPDWKPNPANARRYRVPQPDLSEELADAFG